MPRNQLNNGKGRHMAYNAQNELCITVVDPVTRKLLIPLPYIYETRAQQRPTLPSLCQLFLTNRCRQGSNCYQVHANWDIVQSLRAQVDCLPYCCVEHGDMDRAGVLLSSEEYAEVGRCEDNGLSLQDVVLYLPGCAFGDDHVALTRVSYTVGLKRLLNEQNPLAGTHTVAVMEGGEWKNRLLLDGTGATICRLHAMDRCRYAEECKFLHLCKDLTRENPHLTRDPNQHHNHTLHRWASDTVTDGASASVTEPVDTAVTMTTNHSASSLPNKGASSQSTSPTHHSIFTVISRQQQQQQYSMKPPLPSCGSLVNCASASLLSLPESCSAPPNGLSASVNGMSFYSGVMLPNGRLLVPLDRNGSTTPAALHATATAVGCPSGVPNDSFSGSAIWPTGTAHSLPHATGRRVSVQIPYTPMTDAMDSPMLPRDYSQPELRRLHTDEDHVRGDGGSYLDGTTEDIRMPSFPEDGGDMAAMPPFHGEGGSFCSNSNGGGADMSATTRGVCWRHNPYSYSGVDVKAL